MISLIQFKYYKAFYAAVIVLYDGNMSVIGKIPFKYISLFDFDCLYNYIKDLTFVPVNFVEVEGI